MKTPTLSPSQNLIDILNIMLRGSITKKQMSGDTNMSYQMLSKILRGEPVNFNHVRRLQRYEEANRPEKQDVLDGIHRLRAAGISKLDIALQASMGRPTLEDFIIGDRTTRPLQLRKLDYAINALEDNYKYRVQVHERLMEAIDNGITIKDISNASGIGLSAIYEIVHAGANPRKITVIKLDKALVKLQAS